MIQATYSYFFPKFFIGNNFFSFIFLTSFIYLFILTNIRKISVNQCMESKNAGRYLLVISFLITVIPRTLTASPPKKCFIYNIRNTFFLEGSTHISICIKSNVT